MPPLQAREARKDPRGLPAHATEGHEQATQHPGENDMNSSTVVRSVASKHRPKYPRRFSPLGALAILDPVAWEAKIKAAMVKSGGRVPDAAADLDISTRRLFKILQDRRFKDVERAPKGKPPS